MAGVAGQPLFRHQPGQHRLGPLLRRRHHSRVDDVRVSNPASNPELLQELGKRFTDYHYDFKKLVRDICTSRTYQLATQTNASNQRRHAQLRPRRHSPDQGRDVPGLHQPGDRDEEQVPRPAAGGPGGADRRRQRQHLLPDHVRPGDARDGLLVRGQAGADAVAVAAPAQRRHDDPEDPGRQPDRPPAGGQEVARGDHRRALRPLPQPQADGEGTCRGSMRCWRSSRTRSRRWRTCSGRC